MTTKSERNELTKARARAVGAKLFAEQGYGETTTRQLAAAMNVTNGTFYYYFDSKEDLLYEISTEALEETTTALTRALADVTDPQERIAAMIATHMSVILGSPDSHKTSLELNWRVLAQEKRDRVVAARGLYEGLLRAEIENGQRVGVLRDNTPAGVLTLLLLNMMNWTIFWFRPDGELSVPALIAHMQECFLDGARVRR
jgi:AcrR family transcriptional regulator